MFLSKNHEWYLTFIKRHYPYSFRAPFIHDETVKDPRKTHDLQENGGKGKSERMPKGEGGGGYHRAEAASARTPIKLAAAPPSPAA